MKLYFYIFKLFAFACIVKAETNIKYTTDGVLREDGECSINFINFGYDDTIKNLSIELSGSTLTISSLINGNEGLNNENGNSFKSNEIKDFIKVNQNGDEITNYEVTNYQNGKYTLNITGINSCKGLTIKQVYKYNPLFSTYLLYHNEIPKSINQHFPSEQFGPSSNDVPYDNVYWNMNDGLDELRKECGIYIKYGDYTTSYEKHFVWYISTENININECSNEEFYKIVRKHFKNYDVMKELFGNYYEGYVLKRETNSGIPHMDGIIKSQYIIEVYQKACGIQNNEQVVCTISSNNTLTFDQFTEKLRSNCLSLIIDKNEEGIWTASSTKTIGQFENYSIYVENHDEESSLPDDSNGEINYKTFTAASSSGIARFKTSFHCRDGTYSDDKCRCHACSLGCTKCNDAKTCLQCEGEGRTLIDGICVCKKSYYEDPTSHECKKCDASCATCNEKGKCTTCLDSNALFSDGACICKNSYLTGEGKCFICDKGCKSCDENGCTSCLDSKQSPVYGKC